MTGVPCTMKPPVVPAGDVSILVQREERCASGQFRVSPGDNEYRVCLKSQAKKCLCLTRQD